uniref:ATP synthase subunit a n=1 Tax=Scorpiops tibetanus TaxID=500600 RepID=A0A7M3UTV6_SCOTI|nr:ATP synthase F0 subunit 6 [Scorpiops tibetanus]QOJ45412.1 ATP synthase F0 subunit 6 [Scorpiops tibetanus]
MMMNLFSVFDPVSIFGFHFNWMSIFFGILFFPIFFWSIPSRYHCFWLIISSSLFQELTSIFQKKWKGVGFLLVSLFWFIAMNNFLGLFPFVFTASSHIVFTLGLALPIWFSLLIFGWINKTNYMFAHLVPSGTPPALMMFMVVIESISNLIRPITLSVRLAANMIAGHLLIVLLGSVISGSIFIIFSGIVMMIFLLILEIAVAFIQAYVFTVLSGLYSSEI